MDNLADGDSSILKQEDLEAVFLEYRDKLYRFIYFKVKNEHEAEDLLSKTFVKFFNFAQKKQIMKKTLKSFLYTTASNTVIDYVRRKKIVQFISLDQPLKENEEKNYYDFFADLKTKSVAETLDTKQLMKSVNSELKKLPGKQQEAFMLRFMDEFSFAEIATLQKTSIGTALSRVRYAVEKLKTVFREKTIY